MKKWSEEEFLNYLLTSDFDENHSPEDLKFLLKKFRNFYRIAATKNNNIEIEKKKFIFETETIKLDLNSKIDNLTNYNHHIKNIYNSIISRKLTFSERLIGKIKLKPNEILNQ